MATDGAQPDDDEVTRLRAELAAARAEAARARSEHDLAISTAQAIDAARVAREVGFDDRANLRLALSCVLVDSRERHKRFDDLFDDFFSLRAPPPAELRPLQQPPPRPPPAHHRRPRWIRTRA